MVCCIGLSEFVAVAVRCQVISNVIFALASERPHLGFRTHPKVGLS